MMPSPMADEVSTVYTEIDQTLWQADRGCHRGTTLRHLNPFEPWNTSVPSHDTGWFLGMPINAALVGYENPNAYQYISYIQLL